jgi:acyl-CoA thioester hydrolase
MGLLHHAAYLRYFERCREEFSRRRGASYAEMEDNGWLIVVVDATVKVFPAILLSTRPA